MPPQRFGPPGPGGAPYQSGDVPLLTHEETAAASATRVGPPGGPGGQAGPGGPGGPGGAVALAERPPSARRNSKYAPGGKKGRPGKGGAPRTRWQRMRKWVFIGLATLVMVPVVAFVIGWFVIPVPSADQAALAQVAQFTYADGSPLATLRPTGAEGEGINRQKVTLDQIPLQVRQAVLAAEDRSFYSNPGFDFMGIGRAIFNQLTGGVGGGSTITQQYVKKATGQDQHSYWRKFREVVLAVKISREQTKDQILENYLNIIPFGRGAYGIQAAAKAYFGKDVGQLDVSEGAMLAGLIQAPYGWDPAKNLAKSQSRWNFVLDGMVQEGWLPKAERDQQVFPKWLPSAPDSTGVPGDDRYHIYERAMAELASHNISEDQINTLGLTITTTIDPKRQQEAEAAVEKVMKGQPENLREALVSVDPRTGAIVAYYGGNQGLGLDYAGDAKRQPGSSFKPFVLAAALESGKGIGLGTIYDGRSGQVFVPGGQPIDNSEGVDCNRCDVKYAMTKSINTVFYKMGLDVGPDRVVDAAHEAGIPNTELTQPARGGIALGDQEVHPVDMASAFATFAAEGVYREPFIVSKVTTSDGQVLYEHEDSAGEQRFPQQVARNVIESMLDVAKSSGFALPGGRVAAAKTGTVQHPTMERQNKDAWTVGFTPSLSTAVWVGTDQSDPIKDKQGRPIYGRMLPGQMWQEFMENALAGTPDEEFSPFVPLGTPPTGDGLADNDQPPSSGTPSTGSPDASDQNGNGDDNDDGHGHGHGNGNGNGNGNDDSDDGFGSGGSSGDGPGHGNSGGLFGNGPGRNHDNGDDSDDGDDQSTDASSHGHNIPASGSSDNPGSTTGG